MENSTQTTPNFVSYRSWHKDCFSREEENRNIVNEFLSSVQIKEGKFMSYFLGNRTNITYLTTIALGWLHQLVKMKGRNANR